MSNLSVKGKENALQIARAFRNGDMYTWSEAHISLDDFERAA
jgi:hypothetical protein